MMNIRFFFTFHFGQSIWCCWVTRTWNTTHPAVITDDDCVGCWAGTPCSKPIPYSQLCKSGVAISQLVYFFLYSIKITLYWYVGVLCYELSFQVKRFLKISIKSVSSPRGSSKMWHSMGKDVWWGLWLVPPWSSVAQRTAQGRFAHHLNDRLHRRFLKPSLLSQAR